MKKSIWSVAFIGAASVLAVGFGGDAEARSLGGWAGSAEIPSQSGDFSESWGTVVHSGSNAEQWEVQLPVDNSGSFSPQLYVYMPNGSNLSCGAVATSGDTGLSFSWTGNQNVYTVNEWTTLSPGTVTVSPGNYLFIGCQMGSGTRLGSINY
jgi:hypothetical protein